MNAADPCPHRGVSSPVGLQWGARSTGSWDAVAAEMGEAESRGMLWEAFKSEEEEEEEV